MAATGRMGRRLGAAVGLGIALALGGCQGQATGPSATDALQLVAAVPPGMGRVIVIIPEEPFAYVSHGDVFVNRRRIGPIQAASVLVADVLPGPQILSSNTELRRETTFAVQPGQTAWVRVEGGPLLSGGLVYFRLVSEQEGKEALYGKRMGHTPM